MAAGDCENPVGDDQSTEDPDIGTSSTSEEIKQKPPDDKFPCWVYGWVILLSASLCSFIVDGITFTYGLLLADIQLSYGSSSASAAMVGSCLAGLYLITGPIAGALVNRFGPRPVIIFGSVFATVAFFLSTFLQNIGGMIVVYGCLGGVGLGLMYLPSIVIVSTYFEKYRGFANGLCTCGSGFGTIALAPFQKYLSTQYHWRNMVWIMSGIVLNGVVFGALMRPLESLSPQPKRDGQRERDDSGVDYWKSEAASDRLSRFDPRRMHGYIQEQRNKFRERARDRAQMSILSIASNADPEEVIERVRQARDFRIKSQGENQDSQSDIYEASTGQSVAPSVVQSRKNSLKSNTQIQPVENIGDHHIIQALVDEQALSAKARQAALPPLTGSDESQESDSSGKHDSGFDATKSDNSSPTKSPASDLVAIASTSQDPNELEEDTFADDEDETKQMLPAIAINDNLMDNTTIPSERGTGTPTKRVGLYQKHKQRTTMTPAAPTMARQDRQNWSNNRPQSTTKTVPPRALVNSDSALQASGAASALGSRVTSTAVKPVPVRHPRTATVGAVESGVRRRIHHSRHRTETINGPLYRKDIFLSTSVMRLPQYLSQPDRREFVKSMTALPSEKRLAHQLACCRVLPTPIRDALETMVDLTILKNVPFVLMCVGNILGMVGLYVPYMFLPARVINLKLSPEVPAMLISVIGIANTLGRIVSGVLADIPGVSPLVLTSVSFLINGVVTMLSPLATENITLMSYGVVFGLCSATWISLTQVILCELFTVDKLTNTFGLLTMFRGISSMVGPPILGALMDATNDARITFYVGGIFMLAACCCHGVLMIPYVRRTAQTQI